MQFYLVFDSSQSRRKSLLSFTTRCQGGCWRSLRVIPRNTRSQAGLTYLIASATRLCTVSMLGFYLISLEGASVTLAQKAGLSATIIMMPNPTLLYTVYRGRQSLRSVISAPKKDLRWSLLQQVMRVYYRLWMATILTISATTTLYATRVLEHKRL